LNKLTFVLPHKALLKT